MSISNTPLITIVTICYNSELYIKRTMESVVNQTYNSIEHIIIDGNSTDKTLEIVKSYQNKYNEKKLIILSESDKGISDAFNKGTLLASGEFINYLNSGDELVDNYILEKVVKSKLLEKECINCFDTINIEGPLQKYSSAKIDLESIIKKTTICHQSVLIDSNLAKKYKFDERLKLEMEYDIWYRLYRDNHKFKHIEIPLSKYLIGGISSQNVIKGIILHYMVACINYNDKVSLKGLRKTLITCYKQTIKEFIKKMIGKNIYFLKKYFKSRR